MSYHVETTPRFDKEFKKLDKYTQQMIKSWIGKICKIAKILGLMEKGLPLTRVDNGGIESGIIVYSVLYKIRS